ncbi:inactivated superfamily I helicase [Bradyrhizobium sp. GM22.5]
MRVFSVPISVPFLRTVASGLLDGRLVEGFEARKEPARLADTTLYLPTRRAMRVVREIFLDEMKADAVVLPRIVALGDIDEDELAFADEGEQFSGATPLDIPPRLGELERRLTLAQLVAAWAKGPVLSPLVVGGPASTLALASDLARLIDDMVTRGVDWSALDGLVPDMLDRYWQHSLEFLRIARIAWPGHLAEIKRIEPAARPRPPDQCRSQAADRASPWPRDRGRFDRLDAGHGKISPRSRFAAAWRRGAARPRH